MDNIFENACLIQLRTSCWTGTKQLANTTMAHIGTIDPLWLKGRKFLVNPEYLSPVKTAIYKARKVLSAQALPFPIAALTLVPKDNIAAIEEKLQRAKAVFIREVDAFTACYDDARQEAAMYLGSHFSSLDYPQNIQRKFRLEWRFIALSVPEKASVLPAHLYEAEKQKFLSLMDEARELAIVSLRQEFSGIVAHLVERLSENDEKPKMIRNNMFEKFRDFLENFSNRNIFQDQELANLVSQAKQHISGLDGQHVKTDAMLKNTLAAEMATLKVQIDSAIENMPRRHIRFADSTPELPAADAA